jgi:hypothetical protein
MNAAPSGRWLLVFETAGDLWLHERINGEIRDRRVTREEIAAGYPALYRALLAADNKDAPKSCESRGDEECGMTNDRRARLCPTTT